MTTEQERAEFEAWYASRHETYDTTFIYYTPENRYQRPSVDESWSAYQAGRAALQSQDREDTFCVWHNDPETGNEWDTGCRKLFELYHGTPSENGMRFCCYCSKPIDEAIDHARRVESK